MEDDPNLLVCEYEARGRYCAVPFSVKTFGVNMTEIFAIAVVSDVQNPFWPYEHKALLHCL